MERGAVDAGATVGGLQALLNNKYLWHSDNDLKDRAAFEHGKARAAEVGAGSAAPPPDSGLEPSGYADSGWDKYYFFSVAQGVTKGSIHPTARLGRARPAMAGPQSFKTDAFSKEDLARAEASGVSGVRTSYMEGFNQIPRSRNHGGHGPIEERSTICLAGAAALARSSSGSAGMARSASEPSMATVPNPGRSINRERTAAEILSGTGGLPRSGPHWPPPPGQNRPDPVATRKQLFQGNHRSIVDLHARDRQAPAAACYTMTSC